MSQLGQPAAGRGRGPWAPVRLAQRTDQRDRLERGPMECLPQLGGALEVLKPLEERRREGRRGDRAIAVAGDELELVEQREQRRFAGARRGSKQQGGQQLQIGASVSR